MVGDNRVIYPETLGAIKAEVGCKLLYASGTSPIVFSKPIDRAAMTLYDLVLVNDYYHGIQWLELGAKRMECLPISGCDPDFHRPYDLTDEERATYACDIAFVGTLVPDHLYSRTGEGAGSVERLRFRHLERTRRACQPAQVRAGERIGRGHAKNYLGGEAVPEPTRRFYALRREYAAVRGSRVQRCARSATTCREHGCGFLKLRRRRQSSPTGTRTIYALKPDITLPTRRIGLPARKRRGRTCTPHTPTTTAPRRWNDCSDS